ncbi:hypothetical protein KY285_029539 [Solanum tuberosum]|nr:hypothetical protein KY285_029539 [Solanum tuberosum]
MNLLRNISYDGEWKLPGYVIYRMKKSWSKLSSDHLMELEYGIQSGRIVEEQIHFQVLKNPSGERGKNLSTFLPLKPNNQNTRQVHVIFYSSGIRFKPYSPQVHATLLDLLEVRKLSHESFEEYIIRWRMEASKIRHLPNEEELVQTLIRSLDGIYYKTLYFAVLKNPSGERSKNLSTALPLKPNNQNTRQVHAIFDSSGMRFKPYSPQVPATLLDLLEVRKLSHESFEKYIIRWRMEASRIRHLPNEEELVQTLIRSLDGIYYKTLYFAELLRNKFIFKY